MIKTPPSQFVVSPNEDVRFQRNISLVGETTIFLISPLGSEAFKLERINAYIPGLKIDDTLPAGFTYPNISIESNSGKVFTPGPISMRTFTSPMAGQLWKGGVRVNAHVKKFEKLRIRITNYDLAIVPNIRVLFIGKRRLQESGYTYNVIE